MPMWILSAIMPLVTGGPEVKFCQSNLKSMFVYLPVLRQVFLEQLQLLDARCRR